MKDVAGLDAEIKCRIAAEPGLARHYRIVISIPGIGPINAAMLVACLPELGAASAKQIALLVGLAPIPDDSGDRRGYRRIKGGTADGAQRALSLNPHRRQVQRSSPRLLQAQDRQGQGSPSLSPESSSSSPTRSSGRVDNATSISSNPNSRYMR